MRVAITLDSGGVPAARNAAFSVLVCEELLRSFSARSANRTIGETGLFSNLRLVLVVTVSIALQIAIQHVAALQAVFETQPISVAEYGRVFGLAALPTIVLEARKLLLGRAQRR